MKLKLQEAYPDYQMKWQDERFKVCCDALNEIDRNHFTSDIRESRKMKWAVADKFKDDPELYEYCQWWIKNQ